MNRIANYEQLKNRIVNWLRDYVSENPSIKSFVVGVSGGIDSAVVSTLCAETGLPTYVLSMPLKQISSQSDLSDVHREFLSQKYDNVFPLKIDLSSTYEQFVSVMLFFDDS